MQNCPTELFAIGRKCLHDSLDFRMERIYPWWRHQMEIFSALLAVSARNSPVTGEFHPQRPVTRSFDDFFDVHLNKRLSKQSRGWWLGTPSCSLWRHCNVSKSHSAQLPHCSWIQGSEISCCAKELWLPDTVSGWPYPILNNAILKALNQSFYAINKSSYFVSILHLSHFKHLTHFASQSNFAELVCSGG